jgi:hypothetical protein
VPFGQAVPSSAPEGLCSTCLVRPAVRWWNESGAIQSEIADGAESREVKPGATEDAE